MSDEKQSTGYFYICSKISNDALENKIAAATAHRPCCTTEHDPEKGKIHGHCMVCGVLWPCKTAKKYIDA